MMLLGDVDELEEERERPQDSALALGPECGDSAPERAAGPAGSRVAGKGADPLLVVEEILALLLDENLAEQVTEEAHVGAERGVGRHPVSLTAAAARPRHRSPSTSRRRLQRHGRWSWSRSSERSGFSISGASGRVADPARPRQGTVKDRGRGIRESSGGPQQTLLSRYPFVHGHQRDRQRASRPLRDRGFRRDRAARHHRHRGGTRAPRRPSSRQATPHHRGSR